MKLLSHVVELSSSQSQEYHAMTRMLPGHWQFKLQGHAAPGASHGHGQVTSQGPGPGRAVGAGGLPHPRPRETREELEILLSQVQVPAPEHHHESLNDHPGR